MEMPFLCVCHSGVLISVREYNVLRVVAVCRPVLRCNAICIDKCVRCNAMSLNKCASIATGCIAWIVFYNGGRRVPSLSAWMMPSSPGQNGT